MVQPLWKTVWKFLTKLNTLLPYNCTPWYLSKGAENLHPHKNLHINVYNSSNHNCQNLEMTTCPVVGDWINKPIYPHNGILFNHNDEVLIHVITWINLENIC